MRSKRNRIICLIGFAILCGLGSIEAQSTDILRLEYTSLPANKGDSKVARYRALINVPINLGNDRYLVLGGEYNFIDFDRTGTFPFDDSELSRLTVIDFNAGYIFKWNENWRFVGILTPRLASNFTNGIQADDFLLNATATMWKEKRDIPKPFRLVLGLTYNSTTGLPVPLPLINYYRRFHPKWSYTLGIPRNNLKFHMTENHTFIAALFFDGYFVNIQNDIILPDGNVASSISLSALTSTLGYQYNVSRAVSFYAQAGVAIRRSGILRDSKRRRVFTLNDKPGPYIRAGFKIALF